MRGLYHSGEVIRSAGFTGLLLHCDPADRALEEDLVAAARRHYERRKMLEARNGGAPATIVNWIALSIEREQQKRADGKADWTSPVIPVPRMLVERIMDALRQAQKDAESIDELRCSDCAGTDSMKLAPLRRELRALLNAKGTNGGA